MLSFYFNVVYSSIMVGKNILYAQNFNFYIYFGIPN